MIIPSARSVEVGDKERIEAAAPSSNGVEKEEPGVIYTCKFPGCTRQYASTDGVRKHCRKSHAEWLREVDLEKASLGCRWAAYCTRVVLEEGRDDPRTTPVGSKRNREIMAACNAQNQGGFRAGAALAKTSSFNSDTSVKTESVPQHREAFGDRGTLVPPQPRSERSSSSENMMPPDMLAVPSDTSTPLPDVSKLTPNAQARQRLGEFADWEGCAASVPRDGGFFAWGMPPLKRGLSLADTRDAVVLASGGSSVANDSSHYDDESQAPPSRQEAFLDSIIA